VSLPSRPLSVSYRALSIVTMRGFPFRSAAFRYLLGNTSSRVMARVLHFGCCLWKIAQVRGSGPDFNKLDRAPKRAAVGASHYSPKSIAVRWRPWLAIRAVASDGASNDHRRFPTRSSALVREFRLARLMILRNGSFGRSQILGAIGQYDDFCADAA